MFRFSNWAWFKLIILLSIFIYNIGNAYGNIPLSDLPIDNYNDNYDILFNKATKQYFGVGFDYRQFKAQGYAESNLNPIAKSSVGAKGLMQIMDATQEEQSKEGDVYDPKWAIPIGIKYDKQLYNQQKSPPTNVDKLAFTFGSYNAGLGNILKAQKKCSELTIDCSKWNNIIENGKISSQKSSETKAYVNKIMKLMNITSSNNMIINNEFDRLQFVMIHQSI